MLIIGLIVFLVILGMFLQALTASPRADAEWPTDTDDDVSTTTSHAESESTVVVA